jgi:hypothetical protein
MSQEKFARSLPKDFLTELQSGRFATLLAAVKERNLDLQIRKNYIDIYADGRCVLMLAHQVKSDHYQARIHRKFLVNINLPDEQIANGNYCIFNATPNYVRGYLQHFQAILQNSQDYAKDEATVEEKMIRVSLTPTAPVLFIDRQVIIPGIRLKVDLMGLEVRAGKVDKAILVELKTGLDNRIQHLIAQTTRYCDNFSLNGFLPDDMSNAYRKVVQQKQELGLLAQEIEFPETKLPVQFLVVLYDYNPKSQLLGRLEERARDCDLDIKLVQLKAGDYTLPSPDSWGNLCAAGK